MYAVRLETAPSFGSSRKFVTTHWLGGNCEIGPMSTGLLFCLRKGGISARKIGGTETSAPITPPSPSVARLRKPVRVVVGASWWRAGAGGLGAGAGGAAGRAAIGWPERSLSQRKPKTR